MAASVCLSTRSGWGVHTVVVAQPRDFPRRVFIEDLRRDGMFLRVTWHSDRSAFVVSHWDGAICVAATRVAATDVADLAALLTNGLTDALLSAEAKTADARSSESQPTLWGRVIRRLTRGRSDAEVVAFPERSTASVRDEPRWKSHDG
jgi:hypothetical protein